MAYSKIGELTMCLGGGSSPAPPPKPPPLAPIAPAPPPPPEPAPPPEPVQADEPMAKVQYGGQTRKPRTNRQQRTSQLSIQSNTGSSAPAGGINA